MADILHGLTQFANLLPENFAPAVEGYFRSNLGLLNSVYDASAWSTGGGSITYPVPGALTAGAKTSETKFTEHVSASDPDAKATISLATQYGIPLFFEVIALKQVYSDAGLLNEYAERGAYALRKAFESLVAGVIQTATTNDDTLATANTVLWADLLNGWGVLGNLNIAPAETSLGLSGTAWGLSVADWGDKYVAANTTGGNGFLQSGVWGTIGQTPIYVLSDWPTTSGEEAASLYHRNAVGYAIQGGVDTLGPTPDVLGGGYEVGLYMNGGAVKAIDAAIVNFTNA